MNARRRSAWLLGLGLSMLAGCQTWVPEAGLTLPSPDYLRHFPQFFPPSPAFPFTRELNSIEEAGAQQGPNAPRVGIGQ